jgi:hypothetical protein
VADHKKQPTALKMMSPKAVYNPYSKESKVAREKEKAAKRTVETYEQAI